MNLWADSAKDEYVQLHADDVGHSNTLRGMRRPSEREMLTLWRDWLLENYVPAYCRSLGATRIFRRCYWVDGLGTATKKQLSLPVVPELQAAVPKRNGRARQKVEFLVPPALEPVVTLSQGLLRESKPITLYGLMLEAGSSKRKELRASQNGPISSERERSLPKESGIVAGSWLEAGQAILKGVEQAPAIFLLNPFGATLFSYEDLALLYQRAVPTELCLLIPHKQLESHLRAASKNGEQASVLTGLLRSDRWKILPTGEEQRAEGIGGLLTLFQASMQRHFQLPIRTITLAIPTGPASIAEMPYSLIFATRRQESLASMNDALCTYHRRIEEQSYHGVLGEEWFQGQQSERLVAALKGLQERIYQQGQAQRVRRWPDLRQQLLQIYFGQFTLQEYDAIMQTLLMKKQVQCTWRKSAPSLNEERVPGNDDTLIWS